MINFYQLQSFVTVISEGSMTGAADKLFLTQPAISQQIRNLEEELGTELLVRGVRQIKPTMQGEVLYDHAKKILHLVQQAEVAVKTMGADIKGQLRVGTLNSLGVQLISPIVSRLLKHNPKLNIKVEYSKGQDLVEGFKARELDILILPDVEVEYGEELSNIEKQFLFREEMWLVGSSKETGLPKQIELKQLGDFPFIAFDGEYPEFRDKLEKALKTKSVDIVSNFESSNVGTLKRVVESGLGWGFLPAQTIKKQVRMGRLNHVQVKDFNYAVDFHYYVRKDNSLKAVSEVFYQALQQEKN